MGRIKDTGKLQLQRAKPANTPAAASTNHTRELTPSPQHTLLDRKHQPCSLPRLSLNPPLTPPTTPGLSGLPSPGPSRRTSTGLGACDPTSDTGVSPYASMQPSILPGQLDKLIGASFSHSDDGFEAVVPAAAATAAAGNSAAGAAAGGGSVGAAAGNGIADSASIGKRGSAGASVAAAGAAAVTPSRLGAVRTPSTGGRDGGVRRLSGSSGGDGEVGGLPWTAQSASIGTSGEVGGAQQGQMRGGLGPAGAAGGDEASSSCRGGGELGGEDGEHPQDGAGSLGQNGGAGMPTGGRKDWHDSEDQLSDGGYWGTPVKGGTPRGDSTPKQHHQAPGGGSLGASLMRRIANFEEISRMISSGSGGGGLSQQQLPTQQQQVGQAPPPAAAAASDLTIAAAVAVAAAEAEGHGATLDAAGLASEGSSDFTIGTAMQEGAPDVGVRVPSGRSSWRASRTTIDQVSAGCGWGGGAGVGEGGREEGWV